jgi:serine/threonine protein kinase
MDKKIGNGKYVLNKVLGTGSFGRVYLAGNYAVK